MDDSILSYIDYAATSVFAFILRCYAAQSSTSGKVCSLKMMDILQRWHRPSSSAGKRFVPHSEQCWIMEKTPLLYPWGS